jgi:hypothetical protein
MESINVVINDEEVERSSSREEDQINLVDPSPALTDTVKASPSMPPDESPSPLITSDTTPITKMRILILILPSDHG